MKKEDAKALIKNHNFSELFVQLGWDMEVPVSPIPLQHQESVLEAKCVAEKHSFMVCVCDAGKNYPTKRTERQRLINQLAKHHYEHLLIFLGKGKQCWTLAIRPQNRPMKTVEFEWHENQDIQILFEKMDGIFFDISEEDGLSLSDVVEKVKSAFMRNAETVTKNFYKEFSKELKQFSGFIQGIQCHVSRNWYAALMLNRLMFIYFIQKKKFLNDDPDYLENGLKKTQEKLGKDKFDREFYRHFLRQLFSEGLGTPKEKRNPEIHELLGEVPYLNGGLFDVHEIEKENKDIEIPDKAFENLFAFFARYNWHLDTRATATGNDINPDVIGYIFEKYINDRSAMGAYYTQEDITGYISRNTIIPLLLNRAKEKCKNAFDSENGIWRLLCENPDNYIYDSVKKGCEISDSEIPENIRCGIDPKTPKLLERRKDWNTKTPKEFGLPTEIWRETIARRQRYFDLKTKMKKGQICEIDDLITYNLDIERFASDALRHYEGSDFIDAFYKTIAGEKALRSNWKETHGITVLDPACGSGAFLFAALNILEPLYEVCVDRMASFVNENDELRKQRKKKVEKKHLRFRTILKEVEEHQNRKYWIYKTIILNNLYGVDIMREAVEIAKLRLFLKLAAEAEYDAEKPDRGLAPLPDIDFNIRSGNSLVGFANMAEFENFVGNESMTTQMRLDYKDLTDEIRDNAREVGNASEAFRKSQNASSEEYQQAKQELSERLSGLNDKMSHYLAETYGQNKEGNYEKWLETHQPFHWLTEFYWIIEENGGFDVVIGNPPYVEYSNVRNIYKVRDYKTESCGNLYAFFIERALHIEKTDSYTGIIIPISAYCTDRMATLQSLQQDYYSKFYISCYADRPSKLFADAERNLSIFISKSGQDSKTEFFTSAYYKWRSRLRSHLFTNISYVMSKGSTEKGIIPKIGADKEITIMEKLKSNIKITCLARQKPSEYVIYYRNSGGRYWKIITDFSPSFYSNEVESTSSRESYLYLGDKETLKILISVLNSSLFYWYYIMNSDARTNNPSDLKNFPFSVKNLSPAIKKDLLSLSKTLMEDIKSNSVMSEERRKANKVRIQKFFPQQSKHIIDKIDASLARYYQFTEEELDYIINKYRMGLGE